jgi:histidyl-tRNA synthetase
MQSLGITKDVQKLTSLRAIDKLDKFSLDEVRKLLGEGRWDGGAEGKGDFTKGAGLNSEQVNGLLDLFGPGGVAGHGMGGVSIVGPATDVGTRSAGDDLEGEGLAELSDIQILVRASGYSDDQIRVDKSVVRGLEYYTGPVFEVELTFETKDEKGRPVRFGSVGGGGRYDGLVGRFRGEDVPATGFSIGVSRLQAALTLLGKLGTAKDVGPVVVTVFDRDRMADYQRLVQQLREANIRAELYLGAGKMGPQMKYADKRGAPCVVIQGGDEKAKGEVQIKDLVLGAGLTAIKDRDEYLRKQAEAQFACKEEELVEKVRQVLARHARS